MAGPATMPPAEAALAIAIERPRTSAGARLESQARAALQAMADARPWQNLAPSSSGYEGSSPIAAVAAAMIRLPAMVNSRGPKRSAR